MPGEAATEGVVIIAPHEAQEAPSAAKKVLLASKVHLQYLAVLLGSCTCPTTRSTQRK